MAGLLDLLGLVRGNGMNPQMGGLYNPNPDPQLLALQNEYGPKIAALNAPMMAGTPGYNPNAPSPGTAPPTPMGGLLSGVAGQGGMGGGGWQDKIQSGLDNPLTQLGIGLLSQGDLGRGLAAGAQGIQQTGDRKQRRALLGLQTQATQASLEDKQRLRGQAAQYRATLPPDSPLAALPDEQLLAAAGTLATREPRAPMNVNGRLVDPKDPSKVLADYSETPEQAAAKAKATFEATLPGRKEVAAAGKASTTFNVDTKGPIAGAEVMYKRGAEAFDSAVTGARTAARNMPIYDRLDEAMNTFRTGATADMRLKGAQILADLGVPIDPNNISEGEALKSSSRILELAAAPKGQGQITENERTIIREQIPNLATSVDGNRKIISMLRKLDDFDNKVADIYIANAEKNNGVVNYVEAAKEVRKLGAPLTSQDESFLKSAKASKPAGAAPAAVAPAAPPADAVNLLRMKKGDPRAAAQFDEVFGPGAAARVLGGR